MLNFVCVCACCCFFFERLDTRWRPEKPLLSASRLQSLFLCGMECRLAGNFLTDMNFFLVVHSIPLPPWVLDEVQKNPDLAYTDKAGRRNSEYVSLGADCIPALKGRTPVQCYADFMRSFRDNFEDLLGDVIIVCYLCPSICHSCFSKNDLSFGFGLKLIFKLLLYVDGFFSLLEII